MNVPPPSTLGRPPTAEEVAEVARRSPLRERALTKYADQDELTYREDVETLDDPLRDVVRSIERKQLLAKFADALAKAAIEPHGTVVELGAGSAWMSAVLARYDAVDRVIAIEFSRKRLVESAPVAIAYLEAPPEKIERLVGDFYDPGLPEESVDLVVMDAAFHHASEPQLLADRMAGLLRRGGHLILFREPSLSWLVRDREKTAEDEHGDFEHGYDWRGYTGFLERAGLTATKVPAVHSFTALRDRVRAVPPLSWLNGTLYSNFTYVGRKP